MHDYIIIIIILLSYDMLFCLFVLIQVQNENKLYVHKTNKL